MNQEGSRMFKIDELNRLYLGVQGENAARTIIIDVSEWLKTYPGGTVSIWSKRNGENTNYTPNGLVFSATDKTISWTPDGVDTFYAGSGRCGIVLTVDSVVRKSKDIETFVTESSADIPGSSANTFDYDRASNKPSINGVELQGDQNLRELDCFDDDNLESTTKAISAGKAKTELDKKINLTDAVAKADIVNNLTETGTEKVLDARQGKALNENIEALDDRVEAIEDWEPSGNGTLDQILRSNGDGTTRWDEAATQEEIGEAVTAWLGEHATQSETYIEVEDTLTVSGAAADSKTVGDKLSGLKSALNATESKTNYIEDILVCGKITFNGSIDDSGIVVYSAGRKLTCFRVQPGSHITVTGTFELYAFYADKPVVGSASYNATRYIYSSINGVPVPTGCKWIAIRSLPEYDLSISPDSYEVERIDYNEKAVCPVERFNIWDEEVLLGRRLRLDAGYEGDEFAGNGFISKNYIPVTENTIYFWKIDTTVYTGDIYMLYFNASKEYISYSMSASGLTYGPDGTYFTTPENCAFIRFQCRANSSEYSYHNDICINVSQPYRDIKPSNGDYIPYTSINNRPAKEEKTPEIQNYHGVKVEKTRFKKYTASYIAPTTGVLSYYAASNRATTDPKPMPESGLYVYAEPTEQNRFLISIRFFKKNAQGQFVEDTDYYTQGSVTVKRAMYFPYAEGIYYVIIYLQGIPGEVHEVYGKIDSIGGRLPNLFNLGIWEQYTEENGERIYMSSASSGAMLTYNRFYASVLRLRDVDYVVAGPKRSLIARIYKVDDDAKTVEYVEDVFFAADHAAASAGIAGYPVIDLSKYDFNGFAVIGIISEVKEENYSFNVPYTGMFYRYRGVMNDVFVKWKAGVSVTYDSGVPSVVKKNMDTIIDTAFAPDLKASLSDGGYSNWARTGESSINPIPALGRCHAWWYAGSSAYNAPHMHVNPKSYITASKNRHSRVYVPTAYDGVTRHQNNLYGATCSQTVALLCGYPSGISVMEMLTRLFEDMEYTDFVDVEQLKPGDVYSQAAWRRSSSDYGHTIYIAEKVSINGEVFCLNSFEGYSPFIGYDTYINYEAYKGYTVVNREDNTGLDLLNYRSMNWFYRTDQPYKIVARPKQNTYKTFRVAYGPYDVQDYAVTDIMCDRGTDSVYGIGESFVVTVMDDTTSFTLKNTRTQETKTVDLTQYTPQTFSGVPDKVYNLTGIFDDYGYYEIYKEAAKMESFYVAPPRTLTVEEPQPEQGQTYEYTDDDEITVYFDPSTENDKVESIDFLWGADADLTLRTNAHFTFDDETTYDGKCKFTGQMSMMWVDGLRREVCYVRVVRRTPYGTYWTRVGCRNSSHEGSILQKAGYEY